MSADAEDLTALAQQAAVTHEAFKEFVAAGFTERQALYLIGEILSAPLRPTGGQ